MRQQLINAIKALGLSGYGVTEELPFDESGGSVYIKNPKRIYIDNQQVTKLPLFLTLNGGSRAQNTTTIVTVFIAVDAKNKPANYDDTISKLVAVKDEVDFPGSNSRTVSVATGYEGDLLISELEYEFIRIT